MATTPFPWTREFSKEFDPRAAAWGLAGFCFIFGVLWLSAYVEDEWIELLKVSLFCFLAALYFAYPAVTLLIARRIGANRAALVDGKLFIRKQNWWALDVWAMSLLWFLWLVAFALWYANTYGAFADGNEVRYSRSVVMLFVGAAGALMSALISYTFPMHKQLIVLDSVGVTHYIGKRALVKLSWDEIAGISIVTRGSIQAFKFETTHKIKPKKNWIGFTVSGATVINAAGFNVEPNALLRTMRALTHDPNVRQWIGTPRGLQFLMEGPTWNEVRKIPHTAIWADGKILEASP